MFPHSNEITVEFMKGYSRLPLRSLKSELDVFSKNKLLPTVIKNTIISQTSYFETVFVISTMFTHVIVKAISLKIYDVIM